MHPSFLFLLIHKATYCKYRLVTKRSQLEALEKAYGHLEKSKGVEMDKLIKKKDEEVTAATEGWTAQHSKLYEALEIRLKKEHEDEMKKNDAVVAGLRRDLALKSAAMQEMAARHDLTVKVLEKKVKDLAERYRANTLLWQVSLPTTSFSCVKVAISFHDEPYYSCYHYRTSFKMQRR